MAGQLVQLPTQEATQPGVREQHNWGREEVMKTVHQIGLQALLARYLLVYCCHWRRLPCPFAAPSNDPHHQQQEQQEQQAQHLLLPARLPPVTVTQSWWPQLLALTAGCRKTVRLPETVCQLLVTCPWQKACGAAAAIAVDLPSAAAAAAAVRREAPGGCQQQQQLPGQRS
jgi:hypothetical protein